MHVLLPPSEAKAPGGRARQVDRPGPAHPSGDRHGVDREVLTHARVRVAAALSQLLAEGDGPAAEALSLPAGVRTAALAANSSIAHSATMSALARYRGVVYEGLDYPALEPAARRLAGRQVLIFSGLFGVVRGNEPIPLYRVPAAARLPGIGVLTRFWRPVLNTVLHSMLGGGLVLDLRSSDYAAMWRVPPELADEVVTVRMLSALPRGGLGVVSHPSKLAKGRLTALLMHRAAAGQPARTAADVAQLWAERTGAQVAIRGNSLELHTHGHT